jgi:hypothetical protein
MTGYREGVRRCELCEREMAPAESLQPCCGLQVCADCGSGSGRPLAQRWRLATDVSMDGPDRCSARVQRPTALELRARLRRQALADRLQKWLGGVEMAVGEETFDAKVFLDDATHGVTPALLSDPVVQQAVLQALRVARVVELSGQGVLLSGAPAADAAEAGRAAITLGACIERWARQRSRQ